VKCFLFCGVPTFANSTLEYLAFSAVVIVHSN